VSEMMVRKQIYLPRRQNQLLKRLAKERGVSEAEIIRQALERESLSTVPVERQSKQALEELVAFARSLRDRPELLQGEPYHWNRSELYDERQGCWFEPDQE
jgi:hypothetical protein